jgi:hypothetical protein
LATNCVLYTYFDAEPERLRTVLTGWYAIGDNWYYVSGNAGIISSIGICGGNAAGCECYRVTNESGNRGIIFQYTRCSDGVEASLNVASGASRTVCVQNGTEIIDDSGLLTAVACPDPCSTNGDCVECA